MVKMYYSDVAEVAESANIPIHTLWAIVPKFRTLEDDEPFTFDKHLLRKLCQKFPTETIRKAVGRA